MNKILKARGKGKNLRVKKRKMFHYLLTGDPLPTYTHNKISELVFVLETIKNKTEANEMTCSKGSK